MTTLIINVINYNSDYIPHKSIILQLTLSEYLWNTHLATRCITYGVSIVR